jgi:hypothetical protein
MGAQDMKNERTMKSYFLLFLVVTSLCACGQTGQTNSAMQIEAGGQGFSLWTSSNENYNQWYVGDFNGDGLAALMEQVDDYGGAKVLLSTGAGFSNPEIWTLEVHTGPFQCEDGNCYNTLGPLVSFPFICNQNIGWYVGDFNGDGKADLMRQINKYGGAEVLLSTGTGFQNAEVWTPAGHNGLFEWTYVDECQEFCNITCKTDCEPSCQMSLDWYVGDFNGDGKADLMRQINKYGGAEVLLSTGTGFQNAEIWTPAGFNSERWFVGDFNGDGRDDLMNYEGYVLFSDGGAFQDKVYWTDNTYKSNIYHCYGIGCEQYHWLLFYSPWILGDFTGDFKTDIAIDRRVGFVQDVGVEVCPSPF